MADSIPTPPTRERVPRRPRATGSTGSTDTPPRRAPDSNAQATGAPAQEAPTRAPRRGPKPKLQKSLEEVFAAPALAYKMTGDEWATDFVKDRAEPLAEAWYNLAQESPPVKRILEKLTTGSAWGGVAIATGATVLPLLAHHQLLPGPLGSVFSVPTTGAPRGPIVPPPPPRTPSIPATPPGPGRVSNGEGGGGAPSGMTPPIGDGQPAGVVTVAGTNAVVSGYDPGN